ncbi:hypothetical protein BH18GEM1_BH18GEM1_03710 [soil metagenome]
MIVAALLLAALPADTAGQTSAAEAKAASAGGDTWRIEVLEATAGTPEIDGELDDPVWQTAQWVSGFTQREPIEGAAATLGTEVTFVYGERALYVGARMHSDDPAQIGNQMTRRDEPGNSERLIVSFDTYHDRRTAYSFAVSAAGVRLDYFHPTDTDDFSERDFTYDPVWDAATEVTSEGWTAEMRIPFSQLRFNDSEEQVWGVNINRYIPALNEDDFWIVVPRDETGWASRFGELVGIRGIEPSRRIELVPYVASSARITSDGLFDADDPFAEQTDMDARTGLDFRMGLGPNLTLDAAINPDFGQVEADPAEVNLTAFETFFDERRPFFTSGQENFDGVGPDYYYSRRIGAPPHGVAGGDFVDRPSITTILGAAKVTGRLPSGLTLGGLAAVSDDERARAFDIATDTVQEIKVEPYTGYGVVRLQQQIGENASTLGLTLTGMQRSLEGGTPLAARVAERAFSGGIDWNKRFTDGWYEILGHVGFSHVAGDTAALLRLQRSSVHFFQRPDQDHAGLDPARESLTGWSAALRGGKRTGNWRWNHGVWLESPGFEINDVGRLRRADQIEAWGALFYVDTEPGRFFRDWSVGPSMDHYWNFGGVRLESELAVEAEFTLVNFANGFLESGLQFESQSDNATRGGPLMEVPWFRYVAVGLFTNRNAPTQVGFRTLGLKSGLGGWEYRIDPELHLRPTDRLTLSLLPRYVRERDSRQYIATIDGGRPETFGSRYVFGIIDRSEIAVPLRANYSFTPELSLELYAEPFAASGRYFGIGELEVPRTSDLVTYGEEGGTTIARDDAGGYTIGAGGDTFTLANPDFDILSFRSNLVLRWEWRRGSTLFVVWQENRATEDDAGRLVEPYDLLDSFGTDGEDILAVKFTYWLPL